MYYQSQHFFALLMNCHTKYNFISLSIFKVIIPIDHIKTNLKLYKTNVSNLFKKIIEVSDFRTPIHCTPDRPSDGHHRRYQLLLC